MGRVRFMFIPTTWWGRMLYLLVVAFQCFYYYAKDFNEPVKPLVIAGFFIDVASFLVPVVFVVALIRAVCLVIGVLKEPSA